MTGIDRRTKPARRWHNLFSEFLNAHLPVGGPNIGHRAAAKGAATTTLMLEKLERDLVSGQPVDGAILVRLQRRLDRYLFTLGLAPQPETDDEKSDSKAALQRLRDPATWKSEKDKPQ